MRCDICGKELHPTEIAMNHVRLAKAESLNEFDERDFYPCNRCRGDLFALAVALIHLRDKNPGDANFMAAISLDEEEPLKIIRSETSFDAVEAVDKVEKALAYWLANFDSVQPTDLITNGFVTVREWYQARPIAQMLWIRHSDPSKEGNSIGMTDNAIATEKFVNSEAYKEAESRPSLYECEYCGEIGSEGEMERCVICGQMVCADSCSDEREAGTVCLGCIAQGRDGEDDE